jgi:transporter family protein
MWAVFAILAALTYSIVNIIDKIAISKEMKDPLLAAVIFGGIMLLVFGSIGFFVDVMVPNLIIVIALGAGVLSWFGVLLYYKILVKEEVSKFIPLVSLSPIFIMILAFFLLGESFGVMKYFGVFLLVGGAIVISLKELRFKFGLKEGLLVIFAVVLMLALGNIAIKYTTLRASVWPIMFWAGIGNGAMALLTFFLHHPHVRGKAKEKGVRHLILANVLTMVGTMFSFFAISLGPVTLVKSLAEIQILFVFFWASMLSKFYPKALKEKINGRIVLQKVIAIVLIIAGAVLVI